MGRAERRRAAKLGVRESLLDLPTTDFDIARLPIGRAINRGGRRMKIFLAIVVLALPVAIGVAALLMAVF